MDHRISRNGLALAIVLIVIAIVSFIYLNQQFEGPSVTQLIGPQPYEVKATFKDTEALPTKQPVLSKGVQVGKVTGVTYNADGSTGTVSFTVEDRYAPIYNDATVEIGERTVLGDPYLNLTLGTPQAGEATAGSEIRSMPSVDFDEAFSWLDQTGRAHLSSVIDSLGKGIGPTPNGDRLNGTIGGLERTLATLHQLTGALSGQEQELGTVVTDSSTVLQELGNREQALRSITDAGRITLDALAANTNSLQNALDELPRFLQSGRNTLTVARPLLVEAAPLVTELQSLAPNLQPAFKQLGPISRDASAVIQGLPAFHAAAIPSFGKQLQIVQASPPLVQGLTPGVRNLVPTLQYAAPRTNSVASFFSNIASATQYGDRNGPWAHFQIVVDPGETLDAPTPATCTPEDDLAFNLGFCHNAYPAPNDAINPEPYVPGSYTHVMPEHIPPPK